MLPLLDAVEENSGEILEEVAADNGFCSEASLKDVIACTVRGYVAAGRASKPNGGQKAARWFILCVPGSGKADVKVDTVEWP